MFRFVIVKEYSIPFVHGSALVTVMSPELFRIRITDRVN
jgi:hypothetical protein